VLERQPCLEYISPSKELNKNYLSIEDDIIDGKKGVYLYQINSAKSFWMPIKNSYDLLKANELYLKYYPQEFFQKHS
jgi:NDP-sugar pyrophosphorylase family protein